MKCSIFRVCVCLLILYIEYHHHQLMALKVYTKAEDIYAYCVPPCLLIEDESNSTSRKVFDSRVGSIKKINTHTHKQTLSHHTHTYVYYTHIFSCVCICVICDVVWNFLSSRYFFVTYSRTACCGPHSQFPIHMKSLQPSTCSILCI